MTRYALPVFAALAFGACGGAGTPPTGESAASGHDTTGGEAAARDGGPEGSREFELRESDRTDRGHGVQPSKIEATRTKAAIRFFVVDKDAGPISGVVISLTDPQGARYYTEETDAKGFAEVLVPVGKDYELVYLSLGPSDVAAKVSVSDEPKQNIKLTLRYKLHVPEKAGEAQRFVLKDVHFDSNKAILRPESFPRLDGIVEYMTHKQSARIEISGHTDNTGKPKHNKALSEKRAKACRDYLVSKGIDSRRIDAVGYGDERPIADNATEAGRQQNRRIEAVEL